MKKAIILFMCLVLMQLPMFNNVTHAAVHVSVGSQTHLIGSGPININYSFNDSAHRATLQVFYKGLSVHHESLGFTQSGRLTYTPTRGEGDYKITVSAYVEGGHVYSDETIVKAYKDTVVFIPGIMGSELHVEDNKIWIPNGNALEMLGDIRKLKMNSSGETIEDVTVGKPIDEYYLKIRQYLESKNYKVINFPYDWRLDNRENATLLKNIVDRRKREYPLTEVSIVAHSMGGLIATQYVKNGNGSDIDKLITMGTPFLGSPKSFYVSLTGNVDDSLPWHERLAASFEIIPAMANMPAAYQLLPTVLYFTDPGAAYLRYVEPSGPHTPETKTLNYSQSEAFIKELSFSNESMVNKARVFHINLGTASTLRTVDHYQIIGDQIPTPGRFHLTRIESDDPDPSIYNIKNIQGDGTVPVFSANINSNLQSHRVYYIKESHDKLPSNSSVQQQVFNILQGRSSQLASNIRRTSTPSKTLKIKVECPVDLHVYDSSGNHMGPTNGEEYETLPYSFYHNDGEMKLALVNDDNYRVKLVGTGHGELTYSLIWSDENDLEEKTVRFDNVPVTPTSVFTSNTDRAGQITLSVDENGDGVVDRTISPSVELGSAGSQDEDIPTVRSVIEGTQGTNEWYGTDVSYSFAGEDAVSGIYKFFFSLDDSEFNEYIEPIRLTETGIYSIKSYSMDRNRNNSEQLEEVIKVDKTKPHQPKMTIEPLKWTNKKVSIHLSSSDEHSGLQKMQYKIGTDGNWIDYTDTFIVDTEGLFDVFARAIDNAGNISEMVSGQAKIDRTNPTAPSNLKVLERNYDKFKIAWQPSTDNVEVVGYDLYQDDKFLTTITNTDFTFENLAYDTPYTFQIIARDEAENSSEASIIKVKTPRSLISSSVEGWFNLTINGGGTLLSWGINDKGQLGDGTITSKSTAVSLVGLEGIESVSAGRMHTLALKNDGTVWAWGINSRYGNPSTAPVQVEGLHDVTEVAAGEFSSYALRSDGTVWQWEGMGSKPSQVQSLRGVTAIAAGSVIGTDFAYALTTDGTVWSWGEDNKYKQLGERSPYNNNSTPLQIKELSKVKRIAAGVGHGLALTEDGTVWTWGRSSHSGLGVGIPFKIPGGTDVKEIAAGSYFDLVLKNDGTVWGYGSNTSGELGEAAGYKYVFERISGINDVIAIAAGYNFGLASKVDGTLWAWGDNSQGQLGDGTTEQRKVPVQVQNNKAPVVQLSYPLGSKGEPSVTDVSKPTIQWTQTDAALTNFKEFQVQVLNETGEILLDSGTVTEPTTGSIGRWTTSEALPANQPLQVRIRVYDETMWSDWSEVKWVLSRETVKSSTISTGHYHAVHNYGGKVWLWGINDKGQLGDGTITSKSTAVSLVGLEGIESVSAGRMHTLALKNDGTVWAWGINSRYGNPSTAPVQVEGLHDVTEVAAGEFKSYALRSDGTVWQWEGMGSKPSQVQSLTGVTAIAAGSVIGTDFAYALTTDGTVWSWGEDNKYKQLGERSPYDNNSTPLQIKELSKVKRIAAGVGHGLALTEDGTVWTWGRSSHSGLGVGIPFKIPGGTDVKEIAAGSYFDLVLKNDGTVWGYGSNTSGELGEAAGYKYVFERISGINDVIAIAAGYNFGLASKVDGTLWAWGDNSQGQLGDGTTEQRKTPVQVQNNKAPVVQLSYPLGSKGEPSVTNVSKPTIQWTQTDTALTNFKEFQVQVLNESGEILLDSGTVTEPTTGSSGRWTTREALPANQPFQVRVRVYDETMWSDWSDAGWLIAAYTVPTISTISTREQITVSWATIGGAKEYEIEVDGELINIAQHTTYVHANLQPNSKHTYRVRAILEGSIGAWSTLLTTYTTPSDITGVDAVPTSSSFNITWEPVKDATSYDVELSGHNIRTSSANSYIYTGIKPNTDYVIRVRAKVNERSGAWSSPVKAKTLLKEITHLPTVSTSNEIKVSWDAIEGSTNYELEVDGEIIECGNVTSYTHSNLIPNSLHSYRIRAKSTDNESAWSYIVYRQTLPSAVKGVSASETKSTSISILWDPVDGASSYDIQANEGLITSTKTNKTSYTLYSLGQNKTYSIKVRANSNGNVGEWSEPVTVKTLLETPIPSATSSDTVIRLHWEQVYYATEYEVEVDGVVTSNGASLSYTHSGLVPNSQHKYRVRAKSTDNFGEWSSVQTVYTKPSVAEDIVVVSTSTSLAISWGLVPGATGYDVEINGTIVASSTAINYTRTGLTANTDYSIRIRSKNNNGTGPWGVPIKAKTLLVTPVVSAVSSSNEISLSWPAVGNATEYEIEVNGTIIGNGNKTSYTHTGLTPSSAHSYRVRAKSSNNESAWSTAINKLTTPAVVTGVNVTQASTSLSLSWQSVSGATGYDVEVNGVSVGSSTTTSYTRTSLIANTDYTIRVRAKNSGGTGEWSVPIKVKTLLATPVVTATSTNNEIILSWTPITGATNYDLEVDGEVINNGSKTTFTHAGLTPSTAHSYKVRARSINNESAWSTVTNKMTTPVMVTGLSVVPNSTSLVVNWELVTGATGYDIEVNGTVVASSTTSSYTRTGLTANTDYSVRVRAKNAGGTGDWSAPVKVKSLLVTPTVTSTMANNVITLNWTAVAGATSYEVEVDGTIFDNGSKTTYTYSDLASSTTYSFKVRAKSVNNESAWSNAVTRLTPPAAVSGLSVVPANTNLALNWELAVGATGYDVEINGSVVASSTTTSYTRTGLAANTDYTVRVRAKNSGGTGDWSTPIKVKTLLGSPNVTSAMANNVITLNWAVVTGATSYEVDVNGTIVDNGSKTTFTHADLSPNTSYSFKVRAKSADNESAWSTVVSRQTPPAVISDLNAVPTNNSLTLNWEAVPAATGYDVEINGNIVASSAVTSYTRTGLAANTDYLVRVRAKNSAGVGDWSVPVKVKTLLVAPVVTSTMANNVIALNWSAVAGAVSYEVEVNGSIVDNGSKTSYSLTDLSPNTSYNFKVRAKSVDNESAWSTAVVRQTPPTEVSGLNAVPTHTSLALNWEAVPAATGYDVEINGTVVASSTTTSYTRTGLAANTGYSVRVRAKNTAGAGQWSVPVQVKTLIVTPTVTSTMANNVITLNWAAVAGTVGYEVEVNGTIVDNGNKTTYTHTDLSPNTTYSFKVRAKSADNESAWSTVVLRQTPPAAVSGLTIIPTNTSFALSWDLSDGAIGYDVEINGSVAASSTTTSYMRTGLAANTNYTVRVRAKNSGGQGDWSVPVTVKTLLFTPTVTSAMADNVITLNWAAVSGATSYEVEVDGTIVDNGSKTTYTHTELNPNTSYSFRVRAKSANNESAWSSLASLQTPPAVEGVDPVASINSSPESVIEVPGEEIIAGEPGQQMMVGNSERISSKGDLWVSYRKHITWVAWMDEGLKMWFK